MVAHPETHRANIMLKLNFHSGNRPLCGKEQDHPGLPRLGRDFCCPQLLQVNP